MQGLYLGEENMGKNLKKGIAFGIIVLLAVVIVAIVASNYMIPSDTEPITDSSLLDIKEKGKLIVGADVPYGIMEFFDESGNIVGIDVDIANEIASRLGVELEFLDYEWESLFVAVKSGEIDIAIAAMTITPERSEEMLFSIPYFNGGQVIIVRSDNEEIKLPDDLKDKKIGVQKETTGHYAVEKYSDSLWTYDSYEVPEDDPESGMIYDLKNNTTDAIVVDYIAGVEIVKDNPSLKIVGEPFTEEFYGIPTKKGNDALMDEINNILRDLKLSGKLDDITEKWTT